MNTATSIKDASNAKSESNDCTVRAIAVSTGLDYDTVHAACRARGRRPRCGLVPAIWLSVIKDVGFLYADVTSQFSGKTARSIEPELKRKGGRYIVKVSRHAIGFDGTQFIDWAQGRLNRVQRVYAILAVGEVANHIKPKPIKIGFQTSVDDFVFIVRHCKQRGGIEYRIMIEENDQVRWLNMKDTEEAAMKAGRAAAKKRGIEFQGRK